MQAFTEQGQGIINDLSQRYGVSTDAITHMLYAVMNGSGTMAQFNIPELGGSGQWMQGGMTMVGDMFNYGLQNTVNNLCNELSNILANQSQQLFMPANSQSQYQGNSQQQDIFGQSSLFVSHSGNFGNWWPNDLGIAASTGAQNNIRYAYFPATQRLAVDVNGRVTVYDTLDHQIGGVSQQQGGGSSLTFTSQYGTVQMDSLPVVSSDGSAPQPPVQNPQPASGQARAPLTTIQGASESDIFGLIEKLADLKQKGVLSEEEFTAKKAELLQRL